jgi:hypothetical protein
MAQAMSAPLQIDSITVEIHRLGGSPGLIREGEQYIVLAGGNAPASARTMCLEHQDFLGQLNCLRYLPVVTEEQVTDALDSLGKLAAGLLPELPCARPDRPIQIDLVMGAAELWAFPFETCRINGVRVFADPSSNLILTRRIRQGFASHKRPWPVKPRVLFAHAPPAPDLPDSLIQSHIEALSNALVPWSSTGDPRREKLLEVEPILRERDLRTAIERGYESKQPFTHIHVLAHGKKIVDPNPRKPSQRWGLRLGPPQRDATDPEKLADVLSPRDGLPIVVTVASCDSANQAETTIPERSFAQELHKAGIPIVLASQFPLTQAGSVVVTRACYQLLLGGEDARWALHKARLELVGRADTGHDWASLVAYVQLPEGYTDQLMEVCLQRQMALLRAARKRLEGMSQHEEPAAHLYKIENDLQDHIAALEKRFKEIPAHRTDLRNECRGILASAHKRRAELSFWRAERAVDGTERDLHLKASKTSLEASLENYRATFRSNINHHWSGAQQLALEAALRGAFEDKRDWDTTFRAAELHIANSDKEFWAYGTLAELWLLAPLVGKPRNLERAKKALDGLKTRAGADPDAVGATCDQLSRYTSWWTKVNGYFGDGPDLATDAQALLSYLIHP